MLFFRKIFLSVKVPAFFALAVLLPISGVLAQQNNDLQESGQEASIPQAQATLASLFGRGARMPVAPRVAGTIALPSFDKAELQVDKKSLEEAQKGSPVPEGEGR